MYIDEKKLIELQETLPSLNELDVLEWLWNADIKGGIFNELCDKYLIADEENYYADDSKEINDIKPYIKERFGEDYVFAIKDGEYILLSFAIIEENIKYWEISKINVNDQEKARKIAYVIGFVSG